jgi:hypothetical protein
LTIPEAQEDTGNQGLTVIFPDSGLYAVIELKFDRGAKCKNTDRLTANLAKKALKSINTKDYWVPYKVLARKLIKIGLGVTHRGRCQVLVGD